MQSLEIRECFCENPFLGFQKIAMLMIFLKKKTVVLSRKYYFSRDVHRISLHLYNWTYAQKTVDADIYKSSIDFRTHGGLPNIPPHMYKSCHHLINHLALRTRSARENISRFSQPPPPHFIMWESIMPNGVGKHTYSHLLLLLLRM